MRGGVVETSVVGSIVGADVGGIGRWVVPWDVGSYCGGGALLGVSGGGWFLAGLWRAFGF